MRRYSYDLDGRLVVREKDKDNVIYADAIALIKEQEAALAAAEQKCRELSWQKEQIEGREAALRDRLRVVEEVDGERAYWKEAHEKRITEIASLRTRCEGYEAALRSIENEDCIDCAVETAHASLKQQPQTKEVKK